MPQKARGVNRILEKTPAAIYHLPEINATFPCAKKLFIHRHPIDVFTSYRRRLKKSVDLQSQIFRATLVRNLARTFLQ